MLLKVFLQVSTIHTVCTGVEHNVCNGASHSIKCYIKHISYQIKKSEKSAVCIKTLNKKKTTDMSTQCEQCPSSVIWL